VGLFCDIALAARIERVEAQLIAAAASQQNVQRRGFDLLYTRAVLVKPAAVLVR